MTASVRAVLFDVDFTLCRPGPELGPEGYRSLAAERGLDLDPALYEPARLAALDDLRRHPELDHDEEIWIRFTEDIIRGMGGAGDTRELALEIVRRWEQAAHFELYEDALPVLSTLREHGLRLGLVSNTSRDLGAFVRHFGLDVDGWVASGTHGKVKPSPLIFQAALELVGASAATTTMVGDSLEDDVEGAVAVGMHALLLDRAGRFPSRADRIGSLEELPAALGLAGSPRL
ncbi:MAG TPA: HAD-IA family hydrolase [Gaiellaceae bacterium]|nr:HAD-IA family hydrolase [Gaiellaceae bacterium]